MATAEATRVNTKGTVGKVTQVIGSTFDAEFPEDRLPAIYNAVKVDAEVKGVNIHVTGEVAKHLGGSRVRCVALGSTDGMVRGQDCVDQGAPDAEGHHREARTLLCQASHRGLGTSEAPDRELAGDHREVHLAKQRVDSRRGRVGVEHHRAARLPGGLGG